MDAHGYWMSRALGADSTNRMSRKPLCRPAAHDDVSVAIGLGDVLLSPEAVGPSCAILNGSDRVALDRHKPPTDRWDRLPAAVKAGIVAMVKAAEGGGK